MQCWLKNRWPDQALLKHSMHTSCIPNSAISSNSYSCCYVSDLCACILMKKMASQMIVQWSVQKAEWSSLHVWFVVCSFFSQVCSFFGHVSRQYITKVNSKFPLQSLNREHYYVLWYVGVNNCCSNRVVATCNIAFWSFTNYSTTLLVTRETCWLGQTHFQNHASGLTPSRLWLHSTHT